MKSINCSKKRKQTPPWLVKHFKRSFESLYVSNRKHKTSTIDSVSTNSPTIPKMIYLPPKEQTISSSVTVPNDIASLIRTVDVNSSFKISATKSASNGNLCNDYSCARTPEKYFSPLNSNWRAVDTVAKIKRGRSVNSLRTKDSPSTERSYDVLEAFDQPNNNKSNEKKKFNKSYLKRKLAKIFKSTGKLNEASTQNKASPRGNHKIKIDGLNSPPDLPSDALRNLSFTAAMMSKDSAIVEKSKVYNKIEDKKEIPPSALRFWKKPSEEKIKASHRRTQDNIYGSNEILLRINPAADNSKIASELSLFSDDVNGDPAYPFGYDKAFQRYRNIVSQSQHISRKEKTLSVAYDSEEQNTKVEMRNWQSSDSVNTLTKHIPIANSHNDDLFSQPTPPDVSRYQYTQKICTNKRFLAPNHPNKVNIPSISPPAYDRMSTNNKRSRSKASPMSTTSCYQLKQNPHPRVQSIDPTNRQGPKPPPRSDSLIRSFELICKNLQTSISEPRGDSFKIFKNQHDYQAWLKNLPYHNPDKISTLLRLRSKVARRQCVSELLNVDISDLSFNSKRRHSWPLLKRTDFPSQSSPTKRSNSLSRVKNKNKPIEEQKTYLDSPSLCNYSRLYCLRNSSTAPNDKSVKPLSSYQMDSFLKQRPSLSGIKSSAFIIQNRRSGKHRYKQENTPNSRMTLSCHETESNTFI